MVYRCEENLGVKGPNKNKNKDVGLRMTMPQVSGKKKYFWVARNGVKGHGLT